MIIARCEFIRTAEGDIRIDALLDQISFDSISTFLGQFLVIALRTKTISMTGNQHQFYFGASR